MLGEGGPWDKKKVNLVSVAVCYKQRTTTSMHTGHQAQLSGSTFPYCAIISVFYCFIILLHDVCLHCCCYQLLCCGGSCVYVTVLTVDVAGFSLGSIMLTNISRPTVVLWHHSLRSGLFFFLSQVSECLLEESKKYTVSLRVCVCVCLPVHTCESGLVHTCTRMCLHKTSGWSVLIILRRLHNAIKHYKYHKLNIQRAHWRICRLGVLLGHGLLEMMGLGNVGMCGERWGEGRFPGKW